VLGLLDLSGTVQVWEVFVLAGLLGLVNAFDMPIRQSFVVEMVGRPDIVNAVALNSAVFNGARIVGPAVAGVLIALVGIAPCFLINAASYVAVVLGLLMMRIGELWPPPVSTLERTWHSVVDQLVEGLRYVRDTRETLLAIVVVGVVATAALNFQVLLPLLASDVLHGDATVFGFLSAAAGVGSLLGALVLAFGRPPTIRRLLTGTAVVGVAMLGLALSRWLPASLVLMALAGWGVIAMSATTNTIIQLTTPDHLRGRVMSVYTTVFAGSTPIGALFAGAVAGRAGTPAAFAVAGAISVGTVVLAVAWWAAPGRRAAAGAVAESERSVAAAVRARRR
jgi:MFS family permease